MDHTKGILVSALYQSSSGSACQDRAIGNLAYFYDSKDCR